MKEIFVDINDYNKSFITATESDNNSDVYKIIITEDGRRFDLTEKNVQMAYAISYTDKGDILNLNVTNPTEGEITLEITNELTRKDGDYTCQLLILGENEYRRHSKYYFNLSIRENLFNKISGEIIESPNIGILQELVKKAEFLNIQLENKNKVAENLNSNLNENISVADPLNNSLSEKIPEAATKKTELENSITKAKEFIDGLDGSQNIPQLRLDVTELQNGLKSNQALAYSGSSISAENTLEGRTEGMRIGGRTLVNLKGNVKNRVSTWGDNDDKYTLNLESGHGQPSILYNLTHVLKENQKYTVIVNLVEYTSGVLHFSFMNSEGNKLASTTELVAESKGLKKFVFTTNSTINAETLRILPRNGINNIYSISKNILILEGDWTNKDVPSYFEGIESFGEQEGNKISILSYTGNLLDIDLSSPNVEDGVYYHYVSGAKIVNNDVFTSSIKLPANTRYSLFNINRHVSYWVGSEFKGSVKNNFTDNVFTTQVSPPYDCTLKVTVFKVNKNSAYCTLGDNKLTPWQPYKKPNKKDILIKEPLRGLDENTCDIMYEDNGQVKVDRKLSEYTFTGDENWQLSSELQDELICFYIFFPLTTATTPILCNNFIQKPTMEKGIECITNNGGGNSTVRIKINKSKLTTPDLEGFKSWLKTNPTTIVYQLATPTIEIVENCVDIDLDTFGEKTYFNILNSLPGTLDFKVPSNIGSLVQSNAKEINNINEFINNFILKALLEMNKDLAAIKIKNGLN